MARKVLFFLTLVVGIAFVQPVDAQVAEGYRWTSNRPDSKGPVSLSEDRTLPAGEYQLAVRYFHTRMAGQGVGTDSLPVGQVLSLFDVVPEEMVTQAVALDLLWGVTSHLTLSATGTFGKKRMDNLSPVEGQSNVYLFYQTEATGLEDLRFNALYNVYDGGSVRAHVQGGVSVPVGSIDSDDETPFSGSGSDQLPYQQQLGSGTVDLMPGFTFNMQNEKASLGLQGKATIRLGENDRGWTMGNYYEGNVWAGFPFSDFASMSLGARYSNWGNVDGLDEDLDPYESPAHNTLTQAGWRVDLPVGLNLVMPAGRFGGNRFGLEFLIPIHQNLEGPQLMHDWTIVAGWQKSVSF